MKVVVSVDFDFFTRELRAWDWGHRESAVFLDVIWPIRYAERPDLYEEMDPKIHADFPPRDLLPQLASKGLRLGGGSKVGVAESHAYILPMLENLEFDLLINLDAHHDFYAEAPPVDCSNWGTHLWDTRPNSKFVWVEPRWRAEDERHGNHVRPVTTTRWEELRRLRSASLVALFACRSGCWTPPHLDEQFNEMMRPFGLELPEREVNWEAVANLTKSLEECRKIWGNKGAESGNLEI